MRDFQEQANKPFEHEAKLKELVIRQNQLNALLDLDKGEQQVAEEAKAEGDAPEPQGFVAQHTRERSVMQR